MEGRALDRQPYQGWAFMVPFLGAVAVAQIADASDSGRAPYAVLGLAAGAAWQILYRRDLVSRLTFPVVAGGSWLVASLLSGGELTLADTPEKSTAMLVYLFCVLVGLVLAEQHLRRQDRRAGEVSAGEEPATNPGTGSP